MENMAEALKIAFAIIMFVLALGLSISSFSQAREAVDGIITLRDRETSYTYVEPSKAENRIVSAETIVPTMYKAYKENFEIRFYKEKFGEAELEELYLYEYTDPNGRTEKIYIIDLEKEKHPNQERAIQHLDKLLRGEIINLVNPSGGLYDYFKKYKFREEIGEYYQEDLEQNSASADISDNNKSKKRVITYILQE